MLGGQRGEETFARFLFRNSQCPSWKSSGFVVKEPVHLGHPGLAVGLRQRVVATGLLRRDGPAEAAAEAGRLPGYSDPSWGLHCVAAVFSDTLSFRPCKSKSGDNTS